MCTTVKVLILTLLCGLVSCEKHDSPNGGDVPVDFSIDGEWSTYVKSQDDNLQIKSSYTDPSVNGFEVGDKLAVFGYYIKNGENVSDLRPNFMYNQLVEMTEIANSVVWSYSPLKYWSNNSSDRFNFYAFYPFPNSYDEFEHNKMGIGFSANSHIGLPEISYTSPDNGTTGTIDFLYAEKLGMHKDENGGKIKLNFKHLMSKIQFKISVVKPDGGNDSKVYSAYVKGLSFMVNKKGVFKYSYNSENLPLWTIDNESGKCEISKTVQGEGLYFSSNTTQVEVSHLFTSFVLPSDITSLSLNLSYDGINYENINVATENLQTVAGKVTTVNLVVKAGPVCNIDVIVNTAPWSNKDVNSSIIL